MLENILQILKVEEYVLFEYQDHESNFSMIGCVQGTRFENIFFYTNGSKLC